MGILKTTKKKHTMKVAFFAAALIGFTNAVSYEQMIDEEFNLAQVDDEFDYEDFDFAQLEDFDFDDDEFAEVDDSDFEDYDFAEIGDEEYDDFNFAQIDSEGYADEDALKVKLNTPDCKDEKKVPSSLPLWVPSRSSDPNPTILHLPLRS